MQVPSSGCLLYSIPRIFMITHNNRPLLSSKNPHFHNEAWCTTFLVKMSFICMRMKNDFHIRGWAPTLVLKQRPGGTRKWPIYYAGFFFWPDISVMRGMLKMNLSPHYRSDKATLLALKLSVNHQIGLLYNWIGKVASLSNSCVRIVSSSVQDGPILLTYHSLHFLYYPCDHCNKFFID